MADDIRKLNRTQIARIVNNDPEAIRAFEQLFRVTNTTTPANIDELTLLVELLEAESGVAINKAEAFQQNFQKLDYIDLSRVGPASDEPRRIAWNDTLNRITVVIDGVAQPLAIEGSEIRTVTGTDSIDPASDRVILGDASAGAVVVNLPAAADATGKRFTIKKTDGTANTVTIDGDGAETIDGAATQIISTQYSTRTVLSDGSQWWIL